MLVTMFTDASWNSKLRRATWACWTKANNETHRYSGIIRGEVDNSAEGELAAIVNGLFVIHRRFAAPAGSKIIIQSDSVEALTAIERASHPRGQAKLLATNVLTFAKKQDWQLDLRHVKGHQGTRNCRAAVNHWCDSECRRLMGELIAAQAQVELSVPHQLELFHATA